MDTGTFGVTFRCVTRSVVRLAIRGDEHVQNVCVIDVGVLLRVVKA